MQVLQNTTVCERQDEPGHPLQKNINEGKATVTEQPDKVLTKD